MKRGNIYNLSVERALSLGYKKYADPYAYLGLGFAKENKKWIIFSPDHLLNDSGIKAKGVTDEAGLSSLGYNIDDYYEHHPNFDEEKRYQIEQKMAAYDRQDEIKQIFGNAHIDFDEVDDPHEMLEQIGYNSFTLKRYKDEDDHYEEDYYDEDEDFNQNEPYDTNSEPKILVWHCQEEKKKIKRIYP